MNASEWLTEVLERAARVAAAIAILVACAVMVHQHTHQADRAPYVAVDDALANVSASMVALGRNGFPASPIQGAAGTADPRRNEIQLNYGYAPFALGAALDWLFGTSYPALRAIHVVGLMLAIGAAWLAFRPVTALAPVLFTGIVAGTLWPVQWPMFRPDIGTAVAAIVAVAFATAALRSNGLVAWLGTGFFAATAFGSHQIAWAMVPWAAMIWLISVVLTEPGRRWSDITIGPFIAVTLGGILGLVAYVRGIGWRVGDILTFWTSFRDLLAGLTNLSYAEVLAKHFGVAWSSVRMGKVIMIYTALAAGILLSIALAWRRHALARPVTAIALPGSLATLMYLFSLGFYRNWHSGYTLLLQLAAVWGAVAATAVAIILVRELMGERARPWLAAITLVGALLLGVNSSQYASRGTVWAEYAPGYVPFSEYESRVLADVPIGSSAAGSVIFGLKSGSRHHLMQTADMMALLEQIGPLNRQRLLPGHLIFNAELADAARLIAGASADSRADSLLSQGGLVGGSGPFSQPGVIYGEAAIVYAEPYGETRVLARAGLGRPAVSLYDAKAQTWASRFAPIEVPTSEAAFVALRVKDGADRLLAPAGLSVRVEPGTYLVEIDISGRPGGAALVTGSTNSVIELEPGAVNPFGLASAGLAFTGNMSLHVILRAPDGIGHVGYFGAPLTKPLTIKRIERLVVDPERVTPLALPPLTDWSVQAAGAKLVLSEDGGTATLAGVGIPVGYQIASPPIAVPADSAITVKFSLMSQVGRLGLGFIDSKGFWIEQPVSDGRLTINTRRHTSVRLLLFSLDGKPHPEPARFDLRIDGAYIRDSYGPKRLYVDLLARCYSAGGGNQTNPECK